MFAMASRAVRRPNALLQQNQESLRSQHLQHASASAKSGGPARPPQLPSSGYPTSLPRIGTPNESEDNTGLGGSLGSSSSTSVARTPSTPTQKQRNSSSSSRNAAGVSRTSLRQARSISLDSPSNKTPGQSPTAKLSPRSKLTSSRGAGSSSDRSEGEPSASPREEDDEDAAFARELEELEELRVRVDPRADDGPLPGVDMRPASSSTTAAGGSTIGYATSYSVGSSVGADQGVLPDDPLDSLQGAVRAHRDMQQLKLPFGCRIETSPGCGAQFFFVIDVADGPYTPATLSFWIKIFDEFPEPGSCSIRCTQRIFHPNVDPSTGRIELPEDRFDENGNRLRSLLTALHQMILAPSASPVVKNTDAAKLLQTNPNEFRRTVRLTLGGGEFGGTRFEKILGKAGVAAVKGAAAARAPLSDATKVELMKIEVMKDQFKDQMSSWQLRNESEVTGLENG